MARRFQVRRDTEAVVDSFTLAEGEPGYKTDTKRFVVGDGTTSGGVELLGGAGGTIIRNTTLVSGANSHWADDGDKSGVNILSVGDRLFVGDAVNHTGNRLGSSGLGTDWISTRAANYFSKNALSMMLTTNRIGLIAGSHTPLGESSVVNMGLGAVSLNEGVNSFGRALYAEAMHKVTGGGGGTGGLEVQCGNFTDVMPAPTSYNVGPGATGLFVGAESAHNYTLGDDETPVAAPTLPAMLAVDIGGGSIGASYQRFKVGMLFRQNALYRGTDGLTGIADAVRMAYQHQIKWDAANTILGAVIRSDVTSIANQDVGLIFANNKVQLTGTGEQPVLVAEHKSGAVHHWLFENASADLQVKATGAGTNIGMFFIGKGTSTTRFFGNGGSTEVLRLDTGAATAVNGFTMRAAGTGGYPYFQAIGPDANIGFDLRATGIAPITFSDGSANRIATFQPGSGATNSFQFETTTSSLIYRAQGTGTDIGSSHYAKGLGTHRFYADNGALEILRLDGGSLAATNGLYFRASGGAPSIQPLGAAADIDLALSPKGVGKLLFGTHSAIGAETISGYIEIKDASGTVRKLAVVS